MGIKVKLKKLNQYGMVSIIVTMILIIVMTLVVIAMSRNAIREQRQALDRQLSDQAFYNAESGINDWVNYLYNTSGLPDDKTACATLNPPYVGAPNPVIGTSGTNKYTCLLYDKTPQSIVFNNLGISDSKTIPITPNTNLRFLKFSWSSTSSVTTTTACNITSGSILPTSLPANCNLGGLEVNITDPGSLTRTNLVENNFLSYFLPGSGPPNSTVLFTSGRGSANQGLIGIPNCVNNVGCNIKIGLGLLAGQTVFLHVKSIYLANDIEITGTDFSGNPVSFSNAQFMIDATGKASDVLRRVQVRVGAISQYAGTDFSIRSQDAICKLITVEKDSAPATATIDPSCL